MDWTFLATFSVVVIGLVSGQRRRPGKVSRSGPR